MNLKTAITIAIACSVIAPCWSSAATRNSELALFKRSISPVYSWAENGLITVPKATPLGKADVLLSGSIQEAGKIEGEELYLTAATIMIGTSSDVEFGYTKRQLIWGNFDQTDIEMDTFHFKARIFHVADSLFPEIALGVNAVSLEQNTFDSDEDILFNPYIAATLSLPIFTDNIMLSVTGTAETLYNEGESAEPFYSAGVDLTLFERLFILAEAQGIDRDEEDPIINVGAKVKMGWLSLGATIFDLNSATSAKEADEDTSSYTMGYIAFEIPFGALFKK